VKEKERGDYPDKGAVVDKTMRVVNLELNNIKNAVSAHDSTGGLVWSRKESLSKKFEGHGTASWFVVGKLEKESLDDKPK